MYISVYITYNYLNCTADEFADCIIYDCIGSIKHNENVHTTCHTCVWPLDSPLRFAFPSSSGGLKYLEILCSLQSTRSKIKDLVKNVEHHSLNVTYQYFWRYNTYIWLSNFHEIEIRISRLEISRGRLANWYLCAIIHHYSPGVFSLLLRRFSFIWSETFATPLQEVLSPLRWLPQIATSGWTEEEKTGGEHST